MIEISLPILVSIGGVYTTTIIGFVMWLNNRFAALEKEIRDRIPFLDYERRHDALEIRVRNLEIQVSSRHWGQHNEHPD